MEQVPHSTARGELNRSRIACMCILVILQGCAQVAKSMSVPPSSILSGFLILTSHLMSPAVVKVPKKEWVEPALIWLTISMPTGSRKTTVYQFLRRLLQDIRDKAKCTGIFSNVRQSIV